MVVEDEPDIYEVLLAMFEMWGIEGVAFVDGEEATAWIEDVDSGRFRGEMPELALIDIRLPGVTQGHHVGQRLRQSATLGQMAIVLITAYKLTPDEYTTVMTVSGADAQIDKPLPQFDEFKQQLEKIVEARRAAVPQPETAAPAPASTTPTDVVSQDKKD
jgi:CheY-like chemotaxis protein